MSAYGDSLRELMKGYVFPHLCRDGSLELIERAELAAQLIKERHVLGGYSISFHAKPVDAEKAGGREPCESDQP